MIWTRAFWKGATERAVKTFGQTLAAVLVAAEVVGLFDVDWPGALSAAGLAAAVSLFTSIGNADFTAGIPDGTGRRRAVPLHSPDEMGG
jgi:hypothetical protein